MGAIAIGGTPVDHLTGYSGAIRAAFRGHRPAWAIASFDFVAVLLAFGAVHAVNGMIFTVPPPADVVTAQETKGDALPAAAGFDQTAATPSLSLSGLAAEARAVLVTPDDLILFSEPAAFRGRFGNEVGGPGAGGFATANARPQAGGSGDNAPPAAEPADPEPTLLAYLPLPAPVSDIAAEFIAQAPLAGIASVAERATGAPLDLTATAGLAIGVDANSTRAGSATQVEASATAAVAAAVGSTNGGASASADLGGAVGATVGAVASLLR